MSALLVGAVGGPAFAHHSYAMFDRQKQMTVTGTVAKFEWVNPHVFLWVYVKKQAGTGYDLYAFETGSPGLLKRHGWEKSAFKLGDKVSIRYFPLKDGSQHGGSFIQARFADGKTISGDGIAVSTGAVEETIR
jgi:hypothetical protein